MLKAHGQARKLGLDMVTLLAHTLHVFKPFKNMFRKAKNYVMAKNKYFGLNKVPLVKWVDKAL